MVAHYSFIAACPLIVRAVVILHTSMLVKMLPFSIFYDVSKAKLANLTADFLTFPLVSFLKLLKF